MKDYSKLQNGSDVRGVASDLLGKEVNLTVGAAEDIAYGFGFWLSDTIGKAPTDCTVAVGRDSRFTGPALQASVCSTLNQMGFTVLDCGLASTPAMFMSCVFPETACDGAVMITAKFFEKKKGGLDKADIKEILQIAGMGHHGNEIKQANNEWRSCDLMSLYCAHLKSQISAILGLREDDRPLGGLKVCVDAGNGAGGFYAGGVLEPLGADISSSQFLEPDGMFLNHAPNPEDKEAMASVSMRTLTSQSDLGLIFDTDVDRSAAVDSRGREIARNGIVAMAAALVAEDHPAATVVTDSITSRQLTAFLEKDLGLKHLRFKRGYRNVINKAVELNEAGTDCQLAIETSGHAALKENYFLDDGAYLATKIVIRAAQLKAEGKKIESLIESLQDPADEKEIRIPIKAEDFGAYGDQVLEELAAFVTSEEGQAKGLSLEEPNYEGVRINFPDGWCLLRKSLHDPILPMNMASDAAGGCAAIEDVMREFLSRYDGLEL